MTDFYEYQIKENPTREDLLKDMGRIEVALREIWSVLRTGEATQDNITYGVHSEMMEQLLHTVYRMARMRVKELKKVKHFKEC